MDTVLSYSAMQTRTDALEKFYDPFTIKLDGMQVMVAKPGMYLLHVQVYMQDNCCLQVRTGGLPCVLKAPHLYTSWTRLALR